MPPFHDHFSTGSAAYAAHRPRYPEALYQFIASLAPAHTCCWDVGTGSGQAAVALANHFDRVIATDASENQIASAQPSERVEYRVALAEDSGLDAHIADAITVAQAMHWFNLARFAHEASRVARPGTPLVAWTYDVPRVSADIDPIIDEFHNITVGDYWPKQRHDPLERYVNIHFPFPQISAPEFQMRSEWTLDAFLAFVRTWSAVKRCIEANGADPVIDFAAALRPRWGDPSSPRPVTAVLTVKAWRIE